MRFLDRLERKYGRFAIPNLMQYIVFSGVIVYALNMLTNGQMHSVLDYQPHLVMQGQVWRVITFIAIPPTYSILWAFFAFMFYYFIGTTLEHQMGTFRFNVYYFFGAFMTVVVSLIVYNFTNILMYVELVYLNTTLLLAFATLNPNYEIRIMLILPVKVKYLAYLTAAGLIFLFVFGPLGSKIAILAGLSNYLLFFGKDMLHRRATRAKSVVRMKQYRSGMKHATEHRHQCHACGRTELDDPSLEFRYCSKCDGYYEYCSDHLKDHEHVHSDS